MLTRALAGMLLLAGAASAAPPGPPRAGLPFGPGEELTFRVRSSRFGEVGKAVMKVSGPETVRGTEAYLLSFDFSARVLFFEASDRTRSWFDPVARRSLRYTKRERSPLSSHDERVEIFPEQGRWSQAADTMWLPTDAPLDELSFLYYVRTLALEDGSVHTLERHFDARRNPVTVTVLGRAALPETGGSVRTIVVELRVPDARQPDGTGRIRMYLTDDELRLPLRLESSMPVGGTMVMTLQSYATISATAP